MCEALARHGIVSYLAQVRIAHVSDCYPPRTGGIETQVQALARAQRASGHWVRVITATPARHQREGDADPDVTRIVAPVPFDLPVHPRARARIAAVLMESQPDVVHVHVGLVSPFAWGALRAVHHLGLPCLITVHSLWGPTARRVFRQVDRLLGWSRLPCQWSAVSSQAAAAVTQAAPTLDVTPIPNGIDPDRWQVRPVTGRPDELRLITVARLAPRKRLLPLLRSVRDAQTRLKGAVTIRLTVVGSGPDYVRLTRFVRRHAMGDAVRWMGRLDCSEIRRAFSVSDAFVQASVLEAFGLAALEARCAGLPVIARADSGTAEVIAHEREGLLVSDDGEMTQAIVEMARNPVHREAIATHNRTHAPVQTWARVCALVQDAYGSARDRVPSRPLRRSDPT